MATTQLQHYDPNRTVGEWVAADFRLASVFTRHGIDFCCGGGKPVERACAEQGLTVDDLLQDARDAADTPAIGEQYSQWPVDFLADYIVNQFHTYTREMLDHIGRYAEKVASAHGAHHPETVEIAARWQTLAAAMLAHLRDEEELLFPYIRQLAGRQDDRAQPDFGSARALMAQMGGEHEEVGATLAELAALSGGYAIPDDACNTFRALYGFLPEFEATTKKHIHLENNILFPKTLELAQAASR
jgi:regulator of cell morphogenesis and NO signaling